MNIRFFGNPQPRYLPDCERLKQEKNVTISCVIPAYNEAKRIRAVLKVLKKSTLIDEIIVVDDGSADNTFAVVQEYLNDYENFKIFRNSPNLGKTDTIIKGVAHAKGNLIIMIDADLVGLTQENIAKMIFFVLNGEYSMTILDRAGDHVSPVAWLSRLFGGERALWKKDFEKIRFPKRAGYLLEVIMNEYYIKHRLKVRTIYCPNLFNALQFDKRNALQALWVYIKMFSLLIRATKVYGFYVQTQHIEEDRLISLYRLKQRHYFKYVGSFAILVFGMLLTVFTFVHLNSKTVIKKSSKMLAEVKFPG